MKFLNILTTTSMLVDPPVHAVAVGGGASGNTEAARQKSVGWADREPVPFRGDSTIVTVFETTHLDCSSSIHMTYFITGGGESGQVLRCHWPWLMGTERTSSGVPSVVKGSDMHSNDRDFHAFFT